MPRRTTTGLLRRRSSEHALVRSAFVLGPVTFIVAAVGGVGGVAVLSVALIALAQQTLP